MVFEGYNGRITVEQDDLVISRDGAKGRSGGPAERRIPLDDVEGAFLQPPPEPRRPGYLQLRLAGEPDEELTLNEAIVHPDVVTFSARQQPAFARLQDWLENGGDLEDEPAAAVAPPAPVVAAAPVAAPAPAASPFAPPPAGGAAEAFARERERSAAVGRPGPVESVTAALRGYATFSGRSRRSEYWWFFLATLVVYLVCAVLDGVVGSTVFTLLAFLALVVPTVAVTVRRLHDVGRSGAWWLLAFAPFGGIVLLVWMLTDSKPSNQFGPSPKQAQPRF